MTAWVTETSNFILLAALVLFVLASYLTMWTRRWEAGFARCAVIGRYVIHGYGFFILFLATREISLIPLYLLELAFFLMADIMQKRIYEHHMRMLYQNMMMLLGVGFLVLARLSMSNAVKQFVFAVLAFAVSMAIPLMLRCVRKLENLRWIYVLAGLGLLFLVLVMGSSFFGAKNWLTIHNITFQPSEFVKLLFVLAMAALLVRETESKYKNLILISVIAAMHVGMLALSNDFGGALIFFVVYLLMLFVVSADVLFPLLACLAGSFAAMLAYQYSGHIRERVLAWENPFSCIEKEGYQIAQSLFAIGNGGWFGTGIGEGMPKTIPVVKSDFIFSAIAEEFGVIFAALLLCVYINSIIWILLLALERREPFYFAVSTGAAALFGVQVFLNIGGVIKLIPSTGVTLGFISYGGSSLISTILLFQGIQGMCSVERSRQLKAEEEEESAKKRRKKQRGKENTQVSYRGPQLRMIFVCSALLLLLCVTTAYFVSVTKEYAEENYENDYNRRIKARENTVLKGAVLANDGSILAQSVAGEDGEIYRLYPYGEITAFVTGRNTMGKTGLEAEKNALLYTVNESFLERVKRKASGELPRGQNLITTLDIDLQKTAYDVLSGYSGSAVALEVKTGRILALVSTPTYNPNEIETAWESLSRSEEAPLFNRAQSGLYPPGSIFKTVTLVAYLREHTAEEFSYTCEGSARFRNTNVKCYEETAHGVQTLEEAFANSCNTAFAWMGTQISDEVMNEVAEELGFGSVWESELSYTADHFLLTEETGDASRVQASFGQGEILMTPYHAAMLTAAIANGGVLKLPYLTEQVVTTDGTVTASYASPGERVLFSRAEADLLTEYMVEASGNRMTEFALEGIIVAGKTGSAEFREDKPAHSWYICFAPADDPQIAVCVLVESVGTGSRYALPMAKEILKEYFELE